MTKKGILLLLLLSFGSQLSAYDSDVRLRVNKEKFNSFVRRMRKIEEYLCLNIFRYCYMNLKKPLRKNVLEHFVQFAPSLNWSERMSEHDDVDALIERCRTEFLSKYSYGAQVPDRVVQLLSSILADYHYISDFCEFFQSMVPLAVEAVVDHVGEVDA